MSRQSPTVDGRVVDSDGRPLKGVRVELVNEKAHIRTGEEALTTGAQTKTRADGTFSLGPRYNLHLLYYANPSFQFSLPGGEFWTGRLLVLYDSFGSRAYDSGSKTNGHFGDLRLVPSTAMNQR